MPWWVLGLVAGVGLFTMLCALAVRSVDGEGGQRRMATGIGMVGAALLLAIGKACYEAGRLLGWWA